MYFLLICADLSKKSKSIKTIHIYAPERSCYAEDGIVYYAITHCFGDIRVQSRKILLNFYWFSIFFHILVANISWTVAQTHINHIILWKNVMRAFRDIYVNCFNRLRLFAEVSTNLKWTFLDNLGIITQKGNVEARKMTPFFSSNFSALTVCNTHFCIWKRSKFSSMWSHL